MKKRNLTSLLASVLTVVILGAFFAAAVVGSGATQSLSPFEAMKELKLIPELERTEKITRIDALSILLNVIGEEESANSYDGLEEFFDTHSPAASYAVQLGIIKVENGRFFFPDRYIRLDDMLEACLRALGIVNVTEENVYTLAKNEKLYTWSEDDDLHFYLTAEKLGEILWNMLFTTPNASNATYAEQLADLGIIDGDAFEDILELVNYEFGDTTKASTLGMNKDQATEDTTGGGDTVAPDDTTDVPDDTTATPEDTTTAPEESTTPEETTTQKPVVTTKPVETENNEGWSPTLRP